MKKNNGITLIALIITIIIMLILVAVSVSILINSGLIGKAKEGARDTKSAYELEQRTGETINVDGVEYTLDEYLETLEVGEIQNSLTSTELAAMATNGVTEKPTDDITNNNLKDRSKIKAVITDSGNGEIPIPVGATYVEGTESTGIVIKYKESEFVWVPITADNNLYAKGTTKSMAKPSTGTYAGTDANGLTNYEGILYETGTWSNYYTVWTPIADPQPYTDYGQGTTKYREPALLSSYDTDSQYYNTILGYESSADFETAMQEEYNAMIDSVKKYGGFYIGRYENSYEGTTIASKYNKGAACFKTWYVFYKECMEFSGLETTNTMQSNMIWDSQLDAFFNWASKGADKEKITATTNGNHSGSGANTGTTTGDKINNIFDLEGNLYEWTAGAASNSNRVIRGGAFNNERPANWRSASNTVNTYTNYSTRMSLYIK